jgi:hypothetical protein
MAENEQSKILSAFQLVLRPVVKILLRYGIGYNEFAEIVKTAFVDVSTTEFGIRGRPTNISRVAVMTGLTRKEVRRLRTKIESGGRGIRNRTTPITEILTRWYSDNDYLDKNGQPAVLPYAGDNNSFSSLIRKYAGDVPPGAMRTELKRMDLVDENDDGSLLVRERTLVPSNSTDNLITCLVHGVYPLLSTTVVNTDPDKVRGEGAAQFTTYSLSVADKDKVRLKRISYDRLHDLAVSFDDLFTTFGSASKEDPDQKKNSVVAVGLYYFEEKDPNVKYEW